MKLYLILDIVTIFFPLALSWDKRVQFYKQLKPLFKAIAIVGSGFILWDILYTKWGVWGFNSEHLLGASLFGLPLEEILFFIVVPYACVFLHDTINYYWPIKKPIKKIKYFTIVWLIISIGLTTLNVSKLYTFSALALCCITTAIVLFQKELVQVTIWRSFLLILIPFLVINGALTGWFTDIPVVWYNDSENVGIRLGTIPVEDIFYNFSLIISIILLRDRFIKNKIK